MSIRIGEVNCTNRKGATCAIGLYGGTPSAGICERCTQGVIADASKPLVVWKPVESLPVSGPKREAAPPLPRDQWPAWASYVAERAIDGEQGVGTTFERLIGEGGVMFKAAWAATFGKLGIDCGCARRKAKWDRLYSYATPAATPPARREEPDAPCTWCKKPAKISAYTGCQAEWGIICGAPICDACRKVHGTFCPRHSNP